MNLIINARDAIGKNGKITINARLINKGKPIFKGAIQNKMQAPQKGAEISIQDNGAGIDTDLSDKIFDPFFTTKDTNSGSGFGLYNCKLFVEDHNGSISFLRNLVREVHFYFLTPRATKVIILIFQFGGSSLPFLYTMVDLRLLLES